MNEGTGVPDDELSATFQPGFLAGGGRYLLFAPCPSGKCSSCWIARDERSGEQVVLSFLLGQARRSADIPQLRENQTRVKKLAHENILRVVEFFAGAGEAPLLAFEEPSGRTLWDMLNSSSEPLPWEFLRPIFAQCCAALQHAHAEGVFHGNISPWNIWIDERSQVKLAGFGWPMHSPREIAGSLLEPGNLSYLSPQELKGEPASSSDDIYSLGAVFYEALTGTPPFWQGDIRHQILWVRAEPIEDRLAEQGIQSDLPPATGAKFLECLAKQPKERPESIVALLQTLELERGGEVAAPNAVSEPLSLVPPAARAERAPMVPPNRSPMEEAAAFERMLPSSDGVEESKPTGRVLAAAAVGAVLLGIVYLGYWWGSKNRALEASSSSQEKIGAPKSSDNVRAPSSEPVLRQVIQAGAGPSFSYRYQPRTALGLDTNAINLGVRFLHEGPERANCAFIIAGGATNNSVGTITYNIRASSGHVIQDLQVAPQASLFTRGRIRAEYSTDGGTTYRTFFSTPDYKGRSIGYGRTVDLNSLNANSVAIRFVLHRYDGDDYNLQFLRDCDDSPAALEITGSVMPKPD